MTTNRANLCKNQVLPERVDSTWSGEKFPSTWFLLAYLKTAKYVRFLFVFSRKAKQNGGCRHVGSVGQIIYLFFIILLSAPLELESIETQLCVCVSDVCTQNLLRFYGKSSSHFSKFVVGASNIKFNIFAS